MAHTKERLVELIEAYAVAKTTSNAALTSLAAGALQQILVAVTFLDPPSEPIVTEDFSMPDEPVVPASNRRKRAE